MFPRNVSTCIKTQIPFCTPCTSPANLWREFWSEDLHADERERERESLSLLSLCLYRHSAVLINVLHIFVHCQA